MYPVARPGRHTSVREVKPIVNVGIGDVILLAHAAFGALGTLFALWVFVEALNASEANSSRTRNIAFLVAASMLVAWVLGGYWYLHYYAADKALILKGPWPFAHNIFMETKEHLFFLVLVLSFYLAIVSRTKLYGNSSARKMVLCVAMLIVLTGLTMEGFGAIVNHGAKVALQQTHAEGIR